MVKYLYRPNSITFRNYLNEQIMQPKTIKSFQTKLLRWYSKNARDLPWRRTKDPYKIWVSEIMLQQTQVDTVIPYYNKWIKSFPSVEKLAKAPLSKAMNHWAGLGYYRRVRMLHEGVRQIQKEKKGKIPNTVEELIKLKGVGKYTAGAIASIAFEQRAPILDGNVIRILTRIFAISSDISNTKTIKKLWEIAEKVLPNKNIGSFNQAMMELGATICLPNNPSCLICPVRSLCAAHKKGKETQYPIKKNKIKLEKRKTATLIFRKDRSVLIEKQPKEGRWGGLWMFPHWESKKEMLKVVGAGFPCPNSRHKKGGKTPPLRRVMAVKHGFTKYQIDLEVFQIETSHQKPITRKNRLKWVKITDLKNYAFPSPHQKIVKKVQGLKK